MERGCLCCCRTVFPELPSQRCLSPIIFQKLGAQTILLNVSMEAKGKVVPKIVSSRSKSRAPISKVKIPEKTFLVFGGCKRNISTESSNLGDARGLANYPVQSHPTNHQCLPPFNLTLKREAVLRRYSFEGIIFYGNVPFLQS